MSFQASVNLICFLFNQLKILSFFYLFNHKVNFFNDLFDNFQNSITRVGKRMSANKVFINRPLRFIIDALSLQTEKGFDFPVGRIEGTSLHTQIEIIIIRWSAFNNYLLLMFNKSYQSTSSEYNKRSMDSTMHKNNKIAEDDLQQLAAALIAEEQLKTKDLQLQIRAYQVQVEAEKTCRVDHGPYIEGVQKQISQIKHEEMYVSQQIANCQLVEGQVTPMEYYLWKKKQRINTYDASIAQLCKELQGERESLERTIEEYRQESQDLVMEVQGLEDRVAQMNSSIDLFPNGQESGQGDTVMELFALNISLKNQYSELSATHQILQENKDIVVMQISDNIKSIESSLRNYFEGQKTKLVKEFKQTQVESKNSEVSPLNNDDQNYKIDPLLADYSYKLKQLLAIAPEEIKKVVGNILQPLSWEKFYWRDFLEVEPKSQQIYTEYRKLENQYMENQAQTEKLQMEIKQMSSDLAMEQMRSTELAENIRKLRKKLKK